ncbi:2-hydroxyacid dehydrogenase [Roseateles cavernae]|uniref:2-hydroxyacid dehydrogenase n=1 Tax=Roseateles cavernae TaxID=3153578 RepID=UPI0032E3DF9D
MTSILISEPDEFPVAALDLLRHLGPVYLAGESFEAASIEVIFVRLARRLDASLSAQYPNLRFIVSPTTGLNHIDLDHFASRGIEVISLRGRTAFLDTIYATAEHTLAMVLALIRKLPQAVSHSRAQGWNRYLFKGSELNGKRVLLLGYGRIGRQMERLYGAFGCQIFAHDVDLSRVPEALRCGWPAVLGQTDVLSIHVNLSSETEGLVNGALLERLPPHAVVVNTARGEIVDQRALLQLLRDGRIAGAALDVLRGEPQPFDADTVALIESIDEGRLLLTPHIAGFTEESLQKVEIHVAELLVSRMREKAGVKP